MKEVNKSTEARVCLCVCVCVCVYGLRGEQGQTENISLARNKVPIGNKIA